MVSQVVVTVCLRECPGYRQIRFVSHIHTAICKILEWICLSPHHNRFIMGCCGIKFGDSNLSLALVLDPCTLDHHSGFAVVVCLSCCE